MFKLHPYIDDKGISRVGGRLEKGSFPVGLKHPIILPKGYVNVLVQGTITLCITKVEE